MGEQKLNQKSVNNTITIIFYCFMLYLTTNVLIINTKHVNIFIDQYGVGQF
jgi:hypothetical protein